MVSKARRITASVQILEHGASTSKVECLIKGEGVAVGLTENPAALKSWMIARDLSY